MPFMLLCTPFSVLDSAFRLMIDLLRNSMIEVTSTACSRKKMHKGKVRKYYSVPTRKVTISSVQNSCMVTNWWFPAELVTAVHLFRHRRKDLAKDHFDIDDIDSPRNGLLLFKPIEVAYDNYQLTIIKQGADYILKIIDPGIKKTPLIDLLTDSQLENWIGSCKLESDQSNFACLSRIYAENHDRRPGGSALKRRKTADFSKKFDFRTTFAALEGKKLVFANLNRPFNRVLNLHARMAVIFAKQDGIIEENEIVFDDFWSDDVDLMSKFNTLKFFES